MKMKQEHFDHMKSTIEAFLQTGTITVAQYERGDFPRSDKVNDLQTRFCWDVFHATPGLCAWVCNNLYDYLNDSHIFTALRAICPKAERKY